MCVGGAINLLVQKHPINSALSLIVVMGSLALLYLLLGAEFVAAVQVIVYAGAVMVLFVFTIMLLNAGAEERTPHASRVAIHAGGSGLIVGLAIRCLGDQPLRRTRPHRHRRPAGYERHRNVSAIPGQSRNLLFRDFLLPFEVTSILILIAILGAVVLARREE